MSFSGSRSTRAIVPQLARLFGRGTMTGIPEAQLLEEFIAQKDEAAFEAIVTRHGPMVLNVCRQLLRDPNDIDDAFQATFVVLVRRASSLKQRDLLGNWLYGVAYRVASRSRLLAARRNSRISSSLPVEELSHQVDSSTGLDPDALLRLHEAVSHLPNRYRIPVVLCYFEGLTHEEAAERLGWPLGSVKGRLARARDLLRKRLVRRGVGLSAATVLTSVEKARAVVVPHLLHLKAIRSALTLSGGSARALAETSAISMTVATLAQGVIRTMVVSQIRAIVIPAVIGIGIVTSGASVIAFQGAGTAKVAEKSESPAFIVNPVRDRVAGTAKESQKSESSVGDAPPQKPSSTQDKSQKSVSQPPQSKPQMSKPPVQPGMMGGRGMGGGGMGLGGGGFEAGGKAQALARSQRVESLVRQLNAELSSAIAEADKDLKSKQILKSLEEPISMDFANETPIEDVLKYIQSATSSKTYSGIPIYVDPRGLQEAEKTLQSPISIKLEGCSLKTTLRLILKQLDLAYCVHDGFLMISTPKGIREELEECRAEFGIVKSKNPQLEQELQMLENAFGGMGGGMGGGMM